MFLVGFVLAKTPCSNHAELWHASDMQHRGMKLWIRLEACLGICCMLHAFHGGSIFTTTADIGFILHLIWWNCRLLWKGGLNPSCSVTCSCCFLQVISIDYGAAEQANGKLACPKYQNPRSFILGQLVEPRPVAGSGPWEGGKKPDAVGQGVLQGHSGWQKPTNRPDQAWVEANSDVILSSLATI